MKITNENNLIDDMKKAKSNSASAYTNFINYKDYHFNKLFCFYEGEDGKYYNNRIKKISNNEIVEIIVGDKMNVIKLWERLKNETIYKDVKKMFFVDRDMDDIPNNIDNDLYITPCYSIENLYANEETFSNIIETEFMINKCDSDFKKCSKMFSTTFKEFCLEMLDFNSLILIRKNHNLTHNDVDFGKYKISKMFNITLENVERTEYYNNIVTDLLITMNATKEEFNSCREYLKNKGNYHNNFRGKQQLEFLIKQIENFKKERKNLDIFTYERNNIHINITKNRLSELSTYAITPKCLEKFILSHKLY